MFFVIALLYIPDLFNMFFKKIVGYIYSWYKRINVLLILTSRYVLFTENNFILLNRLYAVLFNYVQKLPNINKIDSLKDYLDMLCDGAIFYHKNIKFFRSLNI